MGIVSGPGSFAIQFGDHLRAVRDRLWSNLGIISGLGSFMVLGSFADRTSLRGRRPNGRERGKNERAMAVSAKRMRVGDACNEAIVFFIPPLIKYANPTQL